MIQMARRISPNPGIPVDKWGTAEYPIAEEDMIFKSVRGEIILPITKFLNLGEDYTSIDYFIMSVKRSYNSDVIRDHICTYLNYFEKYYDYDRELIMVLYKIKMLIDYNREYNLSMFMSDINRYIIRNNRLYAGIRKFVDDNYNIHLKSNGGKTPNLQFTDVHAKILYEISLMSNMYIPLATHFMYIKNISTSQEIQAIMLQLFDLCNTKYEQEFGIYIYDKLYETAENVVNKSINPDKVIWEKNMIRGVNPSTHVKDSIYDIILQILPKYSFEKNIINFNYYSNRQTLNYKVIGIPFEFPFVKLSASKRDADQNSEFDKYEASCIKKDEALFLQNKCSAEQTVKRICDKYGPFTDDEIEHYRKKLTQGGKPVINQFQKQLIGYLFYKYFGDPISINAINQIDYIKLLIAAKRILIDYGMYVLPYIVSSKVLKMAGRKNINKKESDEIQKSDIYNQIKNRYNNPIIEKMMLEIIGKILSSTFEIIDYDIKNNVPSDIDGLEVPINMPIIVEEVMLFINMI